MRPPATRALVSSVLAPVALIGGWSLAASLQPQGYSSIRDTISQLAAIGTPHRWIMSAGFVLLGVCHLVTASGIPDARRGGRILLAIGGLASALLAAVPLPAHGSSNGHVVVAGFAFGALGLWPAVALSRGGHGPWRPVIGCVAAVVLLALVFAFLGTPKAHNGLVERLAAGAEALWPLVAVQWDARRARIRG